ncbi:MAG: hypothetical protein IIY48_04015, partial [Clostridia bacterium]|nr:hypothetical protein [Clostridia bacterium]
MASKNGRKNGTDHDHKNKYKTKNSSRSTGVSDRRQIGFWETPKSDFVFVWKIYIKNIVASPLR